ncbi:hypothetical protein YC2023_046588 [Brassica napus]|uniref:(rape) hypothetical protein n=1 Tax=Brassica napus TaxID=3708 RepID=A0A817AVG0_BRANA|nr:unnamed protein product [Brassica napus]
MSESDVGSGFNLTNTVQTTSLTLTSSSKQLNQVCRTNVGLDKWQSYLCLRDISLARKDVDTCPPHQSGRLSPDPNTPIRFWCQGWKESHSQGIVIVAPKARARDKPWHLHHHL